MGLTDSLLLKVARRWIAGVDLDTALGDARSANARGLGVIMNFLGEEITESGMADEHAAKYVELQDALSSGGIRGYASVKLTQFGLGQDDLGAERRLSLVAENAARLNQVLYIDMESSKFTDSTLAVYSRLHEKHPDTGVALQSYMKRSRDDLKSMLDWGGRVRLVKGAYRESPEVVLTGRSKINERYVELMRVLFDRGDHFSIATHDSKLIDEAKRLADSKHTEFQFEMLKGIRNELKDELVASGYRVFDYLPFGDRWMAYSRRRLSEHPSNLFLLLRSLV